MKHRNTLCGQSIQFIMLQRVVVHLYHYHWVLKRWGALGKRQSNNINLEAIYKKNAKHYDTACDSHTFIRNMYGNQNTLFVINIIGNANVNRQLVKFRKHSHVS